MKKFYLLSVVCLFSAACLLACSEESHKQFSKPAATSTYMRISVERLEDFTTLSYVSDKMPEFFSDFKDVGKDQNNDWIWEEHKNIKIYNKNTDKHITIPINRGDKVHIEIISLE